MRRPTGFTGFTLIETVIVMALMMFLLLLAAPTLRTVLHRSRIEGSAQQVSLLVRQSRFEAIKRGVPVTVRIVDEERIESSVTPPLRLGTGVEFDATLHADCKAQVQLQPTGSSDTAGGFCMADTYGNQMMVAIGPLATARTRLLKKEGAEFVANEGVPSPWKFE